MPAPRPERPSRPDVIEHHDVRLDPGRPAVSYQGREVPLTYAEARLLGRLLAEPGRAFTRAELLDAVTGGAVVLERTVDVHICALRRKLGRGLIETVRGVGYRCRA